VYGQFHYAVDAVAGLVVAVAVLTSLNAGATRVAAVALRPSAAEEAAS